MITKEATCEPQAAVIVTTEGAITGNVVAENSAPVTPEGMRMLCGTVRTPGAELAKVQAQAAESMDADLRATTLILAGVY